MAQGGPAASRRRRGLVRAVAGAALQQLRGGCGTGCKLWCDGSRRSVGPLAGCHAARGVAWPSTCELLSGGVKG